MQFGEVIEITLPGGSDPPPGGSKFRKRVKSWINFIATTAALAASIGAQLKPNDPVNKTSYDELAKAIEQVQKNNQQNHEDLVAIQNYLKMHTKADEAVAATVKPRKVAQKRNKDDTATYPPPDVPDMHENQDIRIPAYNTLK